MRSGLAPTATQFLTASSIAEAAIQYGSRSPKCGLMPQEMTRPRLECQVRTDNGGVRRAIVVDADKRFDNTASLDLVVVLANDPFFAGDIERTEDFLEVFGVV